MMQMEDKGMNALREKLYDVQIPVDGDIWTSIEGSLRRRRVRRIFCYASSVAAAIVVALFLALPSFTQKDFPSTAVAETFVREVPFEEVPYAAGEVLEPLAGKVIGKSVNIKAANIQESAGLGGDKIVEAPVEVEDESATVECVEQTDAGGKSAAREEYLWEQEENSGSKVAFAFMTSVMPGSSASVVNSSIRASQSGVGSSNAGDKVEQISDTKYSLPLNLGVQMQFPVSENLALGVGVNYTMISSRYDCLINKKKYNIKQSLHYVGIPVNVYGTVVERNNFSFYVNAGAAVEKGIRAVYSLDSYTGKERIKEHIDGIQFSVNAGLGVEYKFSNPAGIYFEPNMVYFFNSNVPRSIRTDQPLQVKGELGVRFHF